MERKSKKGKKEISIRVKHIVFWVLVIIAIAIFVSGIAIYNKSDLFSSYKAISKTSKNPINRCQDVFCVTKQIYTNNISEKDCLKTNFKNECLDAINLKKATEKGDDKGCEKIQSVNKRDSCYMSLALSQQTPSYCQKIENKDLKTMCLNSLI